MSARPRIRIVLFTGALLAPAFLLACAGDRAHDTPTQPATLQAAAPEAPAPQPQPAESKEAKAPAAPQTSAGPGRRRVRVPLYPSVHERSVAVSEGVAIAVEGLGGAITITAQPRDDVFIEATVNGLSIERSAATAINAEIVDGVLRIGFAWPEGGPQSIESGVLRILLPMHARVTEVRTTTGTVLLSGAAGDTLVRTAESDVQISDHRGSINAETTNARITVQRPAGAVAARTSNGVIAVTDAPGRVVALTSNAGVDVRLSDESRGPVRIETSNAVALLTIGEAFSGSLIAETTRSSIEIGPGVDPSKVEFSGPSRASFDFGGGEPSMIKTARGGIKVSRSSP